MRRLLLPAILAVVAVVVFIGPVIFIISVVNDTVDDATRESGFDGVPANPTEIEPGQSLYREANFKKALDAVKKKEGGGAQLISLNVLPYQAEFKVGVGEGLRGYRYWAKNEHLAGFDEKISGTESIEPKKFALETVRPNITARLAAAVRERVRDAKVTNMSLDRDIIDRKLEWSVVAESKTRTGIVFQARADGSGLADPSTFSRRENPIPSGKEALPPDARRKIECVQRAQGDTAKLQKCARL